MGRFGRSGVIKTNLFKTNSEKRKIILDRVDLFCLEHNAEPMFSRGRNSFQEAGNK